MTKKENRRLKISNLSSFIVLGFLEASWAPMVPYIKARFNLDEGALGLLLLCTGIGAFIALPVVSSLTNRFGCKKVMQICAVFFALTLIMLSVSPNLALTAILLLIFEALTVGLDVASNINAVIVESELKKPLMSGFHGGYSVGTLAGSAFMSAMLSVGISLFFGTSAVFALMMFITFMYCGHLINDVKAYESKKKEADAEGSKEESSEKKQRRIPMLVIIIGSMCFIMYALEGAVMSWSGVFANQERGIDISSAGFIYSFFAISMTIMRLVGNRIVVNLGRKITVVTGSLLVAAGWIITVIVPNIYGTCIGFLLVGFGAANIVPQLVSFAGTIKNFPVHDTIAFINALGYSGILLGPVVIGFTSKMYSLPATFVGIGVSALIVGLIAFKVVTDEGLETKKKLKLQENENNNQ
ncbi:MAG: MFS transporter [Succinivibrio sp.]|nr:MFS transporter [Succinivibrio sp.]